MKSKNRIKFLTYALILSMSTTSLTGCENFKYSASEDGKVVVENKISYSKLKDYKLIELQLINGESKLFIVNKVVYLSGRNKYRYWDIFTDKIVVTNLPFDTTEITLVNELDLTDFLITYDEVKEFYTIDDIQRIYDKIVADYEFEKDKELEK